MNYIGSKLKLSDFIKDTIESVVDELDKKIFCDIFAGTGIVGRTFKPLVKSVISNDLEYYSFVLNKNYIGNYQKIEYEHLIQKLNDLSLVEGFIYKHYSLGGNGERQYFSDENAKKIDTIRIRIEEWKEKNIIDDNLYYFLLASLIESADKVANTASVYGAYLKKLKKSATVKMVLKPALFDDYGENHSVYNCDANQLIKSISGDILYMDPPYNQRQYGSNYHMLNTIAKYDSFTPKGKTGLREYNRSSYCKKQNVLKAFEELIKFADFKYIFLSYNNEGLMSENDVQEIMKKYGKYSLETIDYQRFKADKTENRNHKATKTLEYLHILEK
jgi:adenine-specific DNA-methyltransferase